MPRESSPSVRREPLLSQCPSRRVGARQEEEGGRGGGVEGGRVGLR